MKLERRVTKILEKLISVPPRLLESIQYKNDQNDFYHWGFVAKYL